MSEKIIIFIDNYMFDVTRYYDKHPGGKKILLEYNNKDPTEAFNIKLRLIYWINIVLGKI